MSRFLYNRTENLRPCSRALLQPHLLSLPIPQTVGMCAGNTFSDFPPDCFDILACCESCGRQGAVDSTAFPESTTVQALPGRLRFEGVLYPDRLHRGGWVSVWGWMILR